MQLCAATTSLPLCVDINVHIRHLRSSLPKVVAQRGGLSVATGGLRTELTSQEGVHPSDRLLGVIPSSSELGFFGWSIARQWRLLWAESRNSEDCRAGAIKAVSTKDANCELCTIIQFC